MTQIIRRAPEPDSIAADMLIGGGPIAAFFFGKDTPENRKKVYRFVAEKVIRAGKLGGKLCASKRTLRRDAERLTSGEVEAAE